MPTRLAIAVIVIAELFGTSLWLSANAVADALQREWGISVADLGHLTSAVQLGFISGTLVIALTGFADRFSGGSCLDHSRSSRYPVYSNDGCAYSLEWLSLPDCDGFHSMTIKDRIEINPKVMMGKPVICGTRTTVGLILGKLSEGATEAELFEACPSLKTEDVRAANHHEPR